MTRTSRTGPAPGELGWLIDELADHESRIGTLEAPSGESRAAVLARTLANVDELIARRFYTAEQVYDNQVDAGTPLPNISEPVAPIDFVMTDKRRVLHTASAYAILNIVHNGAGAIYAPRAIGRIRIHVKDLDSDTVVEEYGSPFSVATAGVAGQGMLGYMANRFQVEDYLTLPAGNYQAYATLEVEELNGTSGYIRYQNPRSRVQIMEKMP